LDHVVVGRCTEPEKDFSGLWITFHFISSRLLGASIFKNLIMHRVFYLFVLFSVFISCSTKPSQQALVKPTTNDFPYMAGTAMSGDEVNFRELSGNTIIVIFFADCDHCQREAAAIRDRMDAFKKYNLYFISSNEMKDIHRFAKDYQLVDFENVTFVKVDGGKVVQTFGAIPTPSVYIYSAEKKLVKHFNGETNIEEIIKFL
jgi:peroxiredoxin